MTTKVVGPGALTKPTKQEQAAWAKRQRQTYAPYVTADERIEDAFRAGFRAGKKLVDDARDRKLAKASR